MRPLTCNEDRLPDGEGRGGDWILENDRARFVVRGAYAALHPLGEPGGTLVDAVRTGVDDEGRAAPAGPDLLGELVPDFDRGGFVAGEVEGGVAVTMNGGRWFLAPDTDLLVLEGAAAATWFPVATRARVGTTVSVEGSFFGIDGVVADREETEGLTQRHRGTERTKAGAGPEVGGSGSVQGGLLPQLLGRRGSPPPQRLPRVALAAPDAAGFRVALSPESLWPDGELVSGQVDADTVIASVDGVDACEAGVTEGAFEAWFPAGAALRGVREGCVYEGLAQVACGTVNVQVEDGQGTALAAQVVDAATGATWNLARGATAAPVGPDARALDVWAGPAYEAARIVFDGSADARKAVTLRPAFAPDGWVLADLAAEGWPDADALLAPAALRDARAAEGVDAVILLADDDVPVATGRGEGDARGPTLAQVGSRAAGWVWSWPWTATTRRSGHGAVPWFDAAGAVVSPLDQLAASEGGQTEARLTVVTPAWVAAARAEADPSVWWPRPDALWLDTLDDLPTLLDLLDDYVDVAVVGTRTWVRVVGARNEVGVDAGIVRGETTAGTGLRIVTQVNAPPEIAREGALAVGAVLTARVDAADWAEVDMLRVIAGAGGTRARWEASRRVRAGEALKVRLPAGATWAVVVAEGRRARPWSGVGEGAWGVRVVEVRE